MMRLISKFALLIVTLVILYLLISGNLLSRSPLIIAGQLLAIALAIWARRSFQGGQFSIQAEPVEGPLLLARPYQFLRARYPDYVEYSRQTRRIIPFII